ncbi:uncharacterized protein LOC119719784 isoform X2 [Patiria miniata]|uniref:Kringle domain-containing protein n=1 Tax=Patiria miniata TaxID=46514 RepID=A0A913Z054_PATMI|nr:uncharacterized protein LOC119719784 isoform X2 [Patiria miniata]
MPRIKVKPAQHEDTLPFTVALDSATDSFSHFQTEESGEKEKQPVKGKKRARVSPCQTVSDFALNVSSAHGLPNIFRAKTKLGRLTWSLIFFVGIVVSIWQGTLIVVNYLNFQVTTEVKIVTHSSLEFPSVTVCNTNKLRLSAISRSRHRQMLVVDHDVSLPYYAPCVGDDFLCRDRPVCIKPYLLCDGIRQCGVTDTSDEDDCDYECKSSEFKCEKRGGCIPKALVCDGYSNCIDGSDEKTCMPDGYFQCDDSSFRCVSTNTCIPKTYVCDNDNDCADGSDESITACALLTTTSAPFLCDYDRFSCGNGVCIPNSWLCDSEADCANGLDERESHCGLTICDAHKVRCSTGSGCGIQCDLIADCPDGSDEKNCQCATSADGSSNYIESVSCSGIYGTNFSNPFYYDQHLICNNTGTRLHLSSFFNCIGGHITCYEPVTNIEKPCKTVYSECYTSPNGQDYRGSTTDNTCLPWTNPGIAEVGYTGAAYPELEGVEPGTTVGHACCRNPGGLRSGPWCFAKEEASGSVHLVQHNCTVGPPSATCSRDPSPSSRRRRSTGDQPTDSPSDLVRQAHPGNHSNATYSFFCLSGERVPLWQTCNGFPDCDDGSDEWAANCSDIVSECGINEFQCRERTQEGTVTCIPKSYVCDDYPDCLTGQEAGEPSHTPSDESACATADETLPADYFRCANGHKMIHKYDVCNTVPDCFPEKDDEYACTWENRTSGEVPDPFESPLWYQKYAPLVRKKYHYLFDDFSYRWRPFDRVKGEDPPDWNSFVTYSATPDYSDLVEVPKLSKDEVHQFGHQKEDFILQCSYEETKCNLSDIQEFQDDTYGNCFTFNPEGFFATSTTSSRYGLRMTLFLEQSEYISIFGQEAGVRVAISPPGIRPNPTHHGFTVKPGTVTSIGLRYNFVNRKPHPYGKCQTSVENSPIIEDGVVREIRETEQYDRGLCRKSCLHRHILEQCGCSDTLELDGPRCEILNTEQDVCKQLMYFLHQSDNLTCHCPQQCSEVYYTKTSSTSAWPSANFMKHLLKNLHSINQKTKHLNGNNIDKNIVRIEVYYEELNYESTKEEPAYQPSSLFGDIGGIMGLYIGFSFITVFEFFGVIYTLIKNAYF